MNKTRWIRIKVNMSTDETMMIQSVRFASRDIGPSDDFDGFGMRSGFGIERRLSASSVPKAQVADEVRGAVDQSHAAPV